MTRLDTYITTSRLPEDRPEGNTCCLCDKKDLPEAYSLHEKTEKGYVKYYICKECSDQISEYDTLYYG